MKRTREDILTDPSVHTLTKNVLIEAAGQDPVDAYHDVSLALEVLKDELDALLGTFEKDMVLGCPSTNGAEHSYAWSGNMPCTGMYQCVHCGSPKNPDSFNGA